MPSNAVAESPNDAAEPSNAVINAVEYPNGSESESFCSGEKNDLIVVWWCVFRCWIAVIDLFLEFGIEPQ